MQLRVLITLRIRVSTLRPHKGLYAHIVEAELSGLPPLLSIETVRRCRIHENLRGVGRSRPALRGSRSP